MNIYTELINKEKYIESLREELYLQNWEDSFDGQDNPCLHRAFKYTNPRINIVLKNDLSEIIKIEHETELDQDEINIKDKSLDLNFKIPFKDFKKKFFETLSKRIQEGMEQI